MTRHRCSSCGDPVPNGTGHVRSECFRQIAWCDLCWLLEHHVSIPAQRSPSEADVNQQASL